MLLQWA